MLNRMRGKNLGLKFFILSKFNGCYSLEETISKEFRRTTLFSIISRSPFLVNDQKSAMLSLTDR